MLLAWHSSRPCHLLNDWLATGPDTMSRQDRRRLLKHQAEKQLARALRKVRDLVTSPVLYQEVVKPIVDRVLWEVEQSENARWLARPSARQRSRAGRGVAGRPQPGPFAPPPRR